LNATAAVETRAGGPALAWLRRNPAIVCLAAAVFASGAILIALGSHIILNGDEWNLVLERQGWTAGSLLDPHQGHLVLALVVIYKVLLAAFGMASPLPFHVVSTIVYLLAAVLLFAYVRTRVGDWPALFGSGVILFLGASAVDLLSPFQMFFSGAIASGLGALLALERDDRRWDLAACALLVVSTSFSELGIAFSLGALVRIALGERPWQPRLYVPLVPMVLYWLWWLGWGHAGASYASLHNVATAPSYVFDAVGTALGALLGIVSAGDQVPTAVGQPWAPALLVVGLALSIWALLRRGTVPRGLWPVLAIGLGFWVFAAINQNPLRAPDNARYLYPSAVFILLIAAELLRGVRIGGRAILAAAVVAVLAIGANLAFLSDAYKLFWKPGSELTRADLRALEIGGRLKPSFVITRDVSAAPFFELKASTYLEAVRAWGSPAYTESELASAPENARAQADTVLGAMFDLKLTPVASVSGPCKTVRTSPDAWTQARVGPGEIGLRKADGGAAQVALGRFSEELPIKAGTLAPGDEASLKIPMDRSSRPWRLGVKGHGAITMCGRSVA
jgi:hypothetical protein